MKNGDENFNLGKNKENICSICKCDKVPINISKIKEKNIKQIITKINKKDPDTSALIKKCNCKNNNQKEVFFSYANSIVVCPFKCRLYCQFNVVGRSVNIYACISQHLHVFIAPCQSIP